MAIPAEESDLKLASPQAARGRRAAGWLALAALALFWLAPGRIGGPDRALAQTAFSPDSAALAESLRADSLRQAQADSAAVADSLAALGLDDFGEEEALLAGGQLLGGAVPQHPLTYSTSYGTLRNRRTWDQSLNLYAKVGGILAMNRTTITILEDPDVKRNTRNRSTQLEMGYAHRLGATAGLRFAVSRNSDIIGIRQQNSIVRDADEFSLFGRLNRKLAGLPVTANATFGAVKDRQPEFAREGRQLNLDAGMNGSLWRTVTWNASGAFRKDRMRSSAPSEVGEFTSTDRTTDRSGAGGLRWAPFSWLSLDGKGSLRRGLLQRPEQVLDPVTFQQTVVREEVRTNSENGDLAVLFFTPLGFLLNARGSLNNTEILYAADSTRNNVALTRSFTVTAQDTLFGAALSGSFQNGTSENDYTKRPDGYVQEQWRRQADLAVSRRLNRRTTSEIKGGVSLESRRYAGFRPSSPASFAPSSQDLFRAVGSARADYLPMQMLTTGLEAQIDLNRTINLASNSSIGNTDQVGYQVTWRWSFTPWSFWTVTQNNSAGAQETTYPFAPDRDQLSFIYQIRTSNQVRLTRKWSLEMHYGLRYQSRGTYRGQPDGRRLFGKSGGSDQYDLMLRTTYQFFPWLNVDLNQQSFVTESYSRLAGARRVDNRTYRRNLIGTVNASHRFSNGASTSLVVRRSLTWDSSERSTVPPTPPTSRDDGYWQVTASFQTNFDLWRLR